ncbi:SLC15A1 [Lepeophtheirus salmonis]|uniref:Oligopeptide transporter 1 n=1 Tax=Lepeophtheirus salmonis TaxID=72036 RepID=A0A7R8CFQ0_LEPSM|nr:SLC15A1 [Lepeophtheirus salmonis]CAF2804356.1 SLC15A1 [Lepeophtheirus salmonis]
MESIDEPKKLPYPKAVFFIITTEFCERFSFYGMKTVLVLFLNQVLNFSEDTSVVLYHGFNGLCYITPILGAILADSFFGKFRTIFYISILYAIGQVVLTIGAIGNGAEGIPGLPASAMSFLGLFLIGVGTGGIKPCVASFGGEQFQMPEQEGHIKTFFSIFYAAINSGSLISTALTPMFRQNVSCFGQDSCFPLAFGVPAALMVVALLIFGSGKVLNLYKLKNPTNNIILDTTSFLWYYLGEDKYDPSFIDDVKSLFNVCVIFLPFPIFWAIFDQQGSRWIFQATRMNGDVYGFQILPDQMQVINPILILIFIPLFDYVIYPIFDKFKILRTPLQRIVVGGIIAGLSFGVSGVVELNLQKTYPKLPESGFSHVTLYNGLTDCNIDSFKFTPILGEGGTQMEGTDIPSGNFSILFLQNGKYELETFKTSCGLGVEPLVINVPPKDIETDSIRRKVDSMSILYTKDFENSGANSKIIALPSEYRPKVDKSENGFPYVKFFWNAKSNDIQSVMLEPKEENSNHVLKYSTSSLEHHDAAPSRLKQLEISEYVLKKLGSETDETLGIMVHKIVQENSIHLLYLLPQFILLTAAEILFGITSLAFSFTESPDSMKAVLMSVRFLTNAVGNIFDVIVISLLEGVFSSQAYEMFIFMGLMIIDMGWLAWLAKRYTYTNRNNDKFDVVSICSVEDR